jgi:hypothetical protein
MLARIVELLILVSALSPMPKAEVESTYEYQRTRKILRPPVTPLFARRPRRYREHLFDDLPLEARQEANWRYWRSCKRWEGNLPGWRRAILIGQARRWAMTSEEDRSQWGRTMLAKVGGYAVQLMYREKGRTGEKHPARKAAKISVLHRRWKWKNCEEERQRQKLGLPPKTRSKVLPID